MISQYMGNVFHAECEECDWTRTEAGFDKTFMLWVRHPHVTKEQLVAGTPQGRNRLHKFWEMIDADVDEIMERRGATDEDGKRLLELAKARAQARAEILADLMVPHYRTPEDVSREAMARYKARKAGEEHHTEGLNVAMASADLAAAYARQGIGRPATKAATSAPAAVTHHFTDEEVEKLKAFHAGGFSAEDLARVHSVKVEVIRAALA